MIRQVLIMMSSSTVSALQQGGYQLYALRAVETSDRAARPLVWYVSRSYSAYTQVGWSDGFRAYTSSSPIRVGGTIFVGFSRDIKAGQLLKVGSGGVGIVTEGTGELMSAWNTTNIQSCIC
jgi:hypothetical protein